MMADKRIPNLNLSLRPPSPPPSPPPQQPPTFTSSSPQSPNRFTAIPFQPNNETSNQQQQQPSAEAMTIERPRMRRRRTRADMTRITPPYPWSTDQRAVIHELEYLRLNNIVTIKGEVKCKRCEKAYEMEFDLMNKFNEIARFIEEERDRMHNRAPECWTNPNLPTCMFCNKEKCVEPMIDQENESKINWLFLLLGNFLGCLKLKQLKNFCAQTNIHRTGAKNRLIYLTYFALCHQLQPNHQLFIVS